MRWIFLILLLNVCFGSLLISQNGNSITLQIENYTGNSNCSYFIDENYEFQANYSPYSFTITHPGYHKIKYKCVISGLLQEAVKDVDIGDYFMLPILLIIGFAAGIYAVLKKLSMESLIGFAVFTFAVVSIDKFYTLSPDVKIAATAIACIFYLVFLFDFAANLIGGNRNEKI